MSAAIEKKKKLLELLKKKKLAESQADKQNGNTKPSAVDVSIFSFFFGD
jgi:hypothetical protein